MTSSNIRSLPMAQPISLYSVFIYRKCRPCSLKSLAVTLQTHLLPAFGSSGTLKYLPPKLIVSRD